MSSDHFHYQDEGGRTLVRVVGDVDFASRAEFEEVLSRTNAGSPLSISFLDCSFCDSSIIGALMKLRAARPGSELTLLVRPGTAVARVFDLVGIDRVFTLSAGEQAAAGA